MKRVVVTGIGVVAPNGVGVQDFTQALRDGRSGIRSLPQLEELGFRCTVGGVPPLSTENLLKFLPEHKAMQITADGIQYGVYSACEAWYNAGLTLNENETPLWDTALIFGSGLAGGEVIADAVRNVDALKVKRLGSKTVPNTMASGVSAFVNGILGAGAGSTTNASACATGTEALVLGYRNIQSGLAKRVVCGACDSAGPMTRSGFDAMRVLNSKMNDQPERASRPMSASASGFIPSGGAATIIIEELDYAIERGANILAELNGGWVNSGGQRNGGSMTAPNQEAVKRCILSALCESHVHAEDIDLISGHLTATMFDPQEVRIWVECLKREKEDFPKIQSLKSLIGHCLSASGAIEAAACVIQLHQEFLHPTTNAEDIHPEIEKLIDSKCLPKKTESWKGKIAISSSFGFGDVNAAVIFSKFGQPQSHQ